MGTPPFRCGVEAVLYLIGGKWKLLILYHLENGPLRFGALQRCLGDVSMKMLSQQLKEMASDKLVRRIDHKTVPPHVEYELTELGHDLGRAVVPLCQWGERHMDEIAGISEERAA
jgi:DNA-binding HxlR family transcriptional regulator